MTTDALNYDINILVDMYSKRQVEVMLKDTDASNLPAVEPKASKMNRNEKQMVEWLFLSIVSNQVTSGTT